MIHTLAYVRRTTLAPGQPPIVVSVRVDAAVLTTQEATRLLEALTAQIAAMVAAGRSVEAIPLVAIGAYISDAPTISSSYAAVETSDTVVQVEPANGRRLPISYMGGKVLDWSDLLEVEQATGIRLRRDRLWATSASTMWVLAGASIMGVVLVSAWGKSRAKGRRKKRHR